MTFIGKWRNELGSAVEIAEVDPDGTIHGYYWTAVGAGEVVGKREPLIGVVSGEVISFIVNWPDTDSMTSWMGRHHVVTRDDGSSEERISTLWTLARTEVGDPSKPVPIWASFLVNADTFAKDAVV